MLSPSWNKIAGNEVQTYLFEQAESDVTNLSLRHDEMFGLPFRSIASQLSARKKAAIKLPLYYKTKGILYPPAINLEQCSSQATGNFKTKIVRWEIPEVELTIADLTGGLGVDSLFLSNTATWVDYVEPDAELLAIARHNHQLLGCRHIHYHPTSAEEFLVHAKKKYDLLYIDPSRRAAHSKKVFRLADCEPVVKQLFPRFFALTHFVLIKTSPLLDIRQGLEELNFVKKVIIVAVGNECKELLFLLQDGFSSAPIIEAYSLDKAGEVKQFLGFTFEEEKNAVSEFSEPQLYLYEPNAAILKAGAFKLIGKKFELPKLHRNTHFYTSNKLHEDFPGRIFRIDELEFDAKVFPDKHANVITRNYPLAAEALKKKLKLVDGGEKYVIGFSTEKSKYVVLATRLA